MKTYNVVDLKKAARKIKKGIYNTLLSAPTRSGKIPALLSYPGSVIVLGFKGENFFNGYRDEIV